MKNALKMMAVVLTLGVLATQNIVQSANIIGCSNCTSSSFFATKKTPRATFVSFLPVAPRKRYGAVARHEEVLKRKNMKNNA